MSRVVCTYKLAEKGKCLIDCGLNSNAPVGVETTKDCLHEGSKCLIVMEDSRERGIYHVDGQLMSSASSWQIHLKGENSGITVAGARRILAIFAANFPLTKLLTLSRHALYDNRIL